MGGREDGREEKMGEREDGREREREGNIALSVHKPFFFISLPQMLLANPDPPAVEQVLHGD